MAHLRHPTPVTRNPRSLSAPRRNGASGWKTPATQLGEGVGFFPKIIQMTIFGTYTLDTLGYGIPTPLESLNPKP